MSEVHSPALRSDVAARPEADDLAAALASRICHDLVNPLGAIANGLELMILSGESRTPEMELIAQSVDSATSRLRFFRVAYGIAGGQSISRAEILGTMRGVERGTRLAYDWTPPGEQPREEVKAIFLLLQCLESAMPLGGSIRVSRDGETWEVAAEGPRLRVDQPLWDSLGPERSAAPLSLVQFALLPLSLGQLGRRLDLAFGPDRIQARI